MTGQQNNTTLIAIEARQIGEGMIQAVNARDLHSFLEVESEFRHWIKNRIADFDLTQDVDFIAGKFLPGSDRIDYYISLDMAKELSMVERNAKGKQARQYFIECERKAKEAPAFNPANLTRMDLIHIAMEAEQERLALAAQIETMREDVSAFERIAKADGSLCMTDAAKALQQRPRDLIQYLQAHKWIYRRAGSDHWVGYQPRVQSGDLEHKVMTVLRADGTEKMTEQVRVTSQGIAKLAKLFQPIVKVA